MKLEAIRLFGHPGIGDLALSFTDMHGDPFDTIVFAGGNGCGKTAILEAIQQTFEARLKREIGIVELDLQLSTNEALSFSKVSQIAAPPAAVQKITIKYDSSINGWDAYTVSYYESGTHVVKNPFVFAEASIKPIFKTFFSEASVSFNPTPAKTVTTLLIDEPTQAERSGEKLAQDITQLIIDVRAADSEELSSWVSNNPGTAPPDHVKNRRIARFTEAFDYMFPAKRFQGVARRDGSLRVEFEEFGRVSDIDTLSTGEKQIVFRAGFLLKSLVNTRDALILVDEPELSLHPDWQTRIVEFYKKLLSDSSGNHPQLFISTHSPFVVHGSATARKIILEKTTTGQVREMPKPSYPIASGTEAVQAFNLKAFMRDAKQPLLVLVEGESDEIIITSAWEKLRPGISMPFEVRAALGMKNLNITLNDQQLFAKLGSRSIVGVFDFDDAYDQWNGVWKSKDKPSDLVVPSEADGLTKRRKGKRAWASLLPVPSFRGTYASKTLAGRSILSIEFLFEDADIPPSMVEYIPGPLTSSVPRLKGAEKINFARHAGSLPGTSFSAFEPLLTSFEKILDGRL